MKWVGLLVASLGIGGAIVGACSSSGDARSEGEGGSGPSSGGGGGLLTSSGGSGTGGIDQCAGETHEGKLTPVDVVIILDQSGSMSTDVGGQTIWQLVTGALTDFVEAPESTDLGVGLQYFPLPDGPCDACNSCFSPNLQLTDQTTNTCCCSYPTNTSCALPDGTACPSGGVCFQSQCYSGGANATCVAADYAALDVPIDILPTNETPIVASLAMHGPTGLTPTAPALEGAIQAAQAWASAHPEHAVAVVLASDGVPTECDPQDINQIATTVAAALAGSPSILTFVIGLGDTQALNAIAMAGGTQQAFLVSTNNMAGQAFLDALNEIKGSLLACEFDIPVPQMGELDYHLVNVQLTPAGGEPEIIPQVPSAADCTASGGWYYDNPQMPTKIVLCPATCDEVKALNEAAIEIVLGCQTLVQ
jgi:hypothetical protein